MFTRHRVPRRPGMSRVFELLRNTETAVAREIRALDCLPNIETPVAREIRPLGVVSNIFRTFLGAGDLSPAG